MTLSCAYSIAQSNAANPSEIALTYLNANHLNWQLEAMDIAQMRVTDAYETRHNGVSHVYFVQQYRGIDIHGATYNANILHDEVLIAFQSLVPDIKSKIVAGSAQLSAEEAVAKTIGHIGTVLRGNLTIKKQIDKNSMIFDKGQNSYMDIPVHLVYSILPSGNYTLAWDITIEPKMGIDLLNIRVDAASGEIIDEVSLTAHCSFPDHFLGRQHICDDEELIFSSNSKPFNAVAGTTAMSASGAQYNVIPIPFESPNHTDRRIVTDPADEVASPFGWHDQNGVAGAEQTITFGNNVHAFIDRDGDYEPNETVTDGGAELHFDFPFDQETEPVDYQEASATNLFYMNNVMHDVTYNYGFDEAAGNFQFKNYSGAGAGGDYVLAHSQFGSSTTDPPLNNATFGTPSDGGSGRMRMYLWSGAGANELLRVEEPPEIAGTYSTSTTVDWGLAVSEIPVTAEVAIVADATGNPTQGCNALMNEDEIDGKIALIDRGSCDFSLKAYNAQEAGAVGFIICNFDEGLIPPGMGGGSMATEVVIPGVFIANSDCQRIRVQIGNGLVVSLVNQTDTTIAQKLSGSFDNGIIAHEYGHGISNRLTGGPNLSGCLQNYDNDGITDGEQMGEGWSDFFALVTSVKASDDASRARGLGTYTAGRDTNSFALGRPYPYTTDMSFNPLTYDDIAFHAAPHGVGAVWCTMIWDLYWALSEEYGWDEDVYRGTGGNNLAIRLVMDGMKMQPCYPGFVDGRDAILAADTALTGGENGGIIWEVFARRGLGFSAEQGLDERRLDGKEAFDLPPLAIKELKLSKSMSPTVKAGDVIDVILTVSNHKPQGVEGVSLSDVIPTGSDIVTSSASHSFTRMGDMIVFDLGSIAAEQEVTVTYQLNTETNLVSESFFADDMEEGDFNWVTQVAEGSETWNLQSDEVYSGTNAWFLPNVETEVDVSLLLINTIEVTGENPVLHFKHKFNTEKFGDYGILEMTTDGFNWIIIPEEYMIRNGYSSKMPYGLFAIPNLRGWNGSSDVWVSTMVDLNAYHGQSVNFRWRFGSDDNTAEEGWYIDDVEIMDAFLYNSEACVTSTDGDEACAVAAEWGTIVESGIVSAVKDINTGDETGIRAYPNPAHDILIVEITAAKTQYLTIELVSGTGQTVWANNATVNGNYRTSIQTGALPRGFYFIRATSELGNSVLKVILQ